MARRSHPRSSRGFTLLEVMIALAVGGIALGSMYAVGAASTRHFRQQQRISSTQTSLRAAMDQLKHDFQRAGFMSTPNAAMTGETCSELLGIDAANKMAAVAGYSKKATRPDSLDRDALNDATYYTVDQVWLTGNYSTSGEYPGITVDADGSTINVPMNWQSFRRDFTVWSGTNAGDCNAPAFDAAFPPGRLVRLHGLTERNFYSYVRRTSCVGQNIAQVVITDVVPAVCNMTGGWIAPVNTMRYWVTDSTDTSRIGDNRIAVLRRTEVQPGARTNPLAVLGTTVPVEDRALLDYVVRFSVDFMLHQLGNNKVDFVPVAELATRTNPERVRGVVIDLTARTAEHEPEFFSDLPRYSFRLYSTQGAARVRRARAEVLMPNIANRGM